MRNVLFKRVHDARQNRHTSFIIIELKSYRDAKTLIWDQNNCVNFEFDTVSHMTDYISL